MKWNVDWGCFSDSMKTYLVHQMLMFLSWAEKFNCSVSVSSWNVQLQFSSFHEQRFNAQIGGTEFQHLFFWHIKSGRSHVPNGILLLYLHFSLLLFSINPSLCVCSPFDLSLFQGFVTHQNFKSNRASLLGEDRGWRDEPKAHQQIIIRSRVLHNSYLEDFSSCSKFLWLPLLLWW